MSLTATPWLRGLRCGVTYFNFLFTPTHRHSTTPRFRTDAPRSANDAARVSSGDDAPPPPGDDAARAPSGDDAPPAAPASAAMDGAAADVARTGFAAVPACQL